MSEGYPVISRHDFNKLISCGIPVLAGITLGLDNLTKESSEKRKVLPQGFNGIHFNAPYLWKREAEDVDNFINFVEEVSEKSYEENGE